MPDSSEPFVWDGRELSTMEDVYKEALRIAELDAPLMAAEFIDDYGTYIERSNPDDEVDGRHIAMQNLGYFAGYYDAKDRIKLYEVFDIAHPIFGTKEPTPEEAFDMGKQWGQAMKENRPFP